MDERKPLWDPVNSQLALLPNYYLWLNKGLKAAAVTHMILGNVRDLSFIGDLVGERWRAVVGWSRWAVGL